MTTWGTLLQEIRVELKDNGATQKWSDETLYLYAKDAIRDYSLHFPLKYRAELAEASGVYPLPADFVKAVSVECPADRFLEERFERPGHRYASSSGQPSLYYIEGGNLYLNRAPLDGSAVFLNYTARHPIPANAGDSSFDLTIPEEDEELIRLYIKAKTIGQVRTQQAQLDRFKPGAGKRTDNPLAPESGNLMDEYYAKVAERFAGGTIHLWRPGRPR
jgi:hypothetical protein